MVLFSIEKKKAGDGLGHGFSLAQDTQGRPCSGESIWVKHPSCWWSEECAYPGEEQYINKQKANVKRWDRTHLVWCRNSPGLLGLSREGPTPRLSQAQGHLFAMKEGPWLGMYLTPQSSGMNHSATIFSHSFTLNSVIPHTFEMWIFWWPGTLKLTLQRDSITCSLFCSLVRMDVTNQPLWTLGLSKGTAQTCLQSRMETAC